MSTRAEHQARRTIRRHDPDLAAQLDRIVPLGPEPHTDLQEMRAQLAAAVEQRELTIAQAEHLMVRGAPGADELLRQATDLSRAAGDLAFVISQEERLLALATAWRPHA